MSVHIDHMTSTVRVTDSTTALSPEVLRQVVEAVVMALDERDARERRSLGDRRIGSSGTQDCQCRGGGR